MPILTRFKLANVAVVLTLATPAAAQTADQLNQAELSRLPAQTQAEAYPYPDTYPPTPYAYYAYPYYPYAYYPDVFPYSGSGYDNGFPIGISVGLGFHPFFHHRFNRDPGFFRGGFGGHFSGFHDRFGGFRGRYGGAFRRR
jgi:hypothetical protein